MQKYLTLTSHSYDPAAFIINVDLFEELSDGDKAAFVEAGKLGGKASRKAAFEAQTSGTKSLQDQGMQIVSQIDRAAFVAAVSPAMPEFEKKFGSAELARIRDVR